MSAVAAAFRGILPDAAIDDAAERRALLSADIFRPAPASAGVVLRPADAAAVARLVQTARREGVALYPRGGGWSYTGGYAPQGQPAALVDAGDLGGIAIDREGGTVAVGAGTSWAQLHAALDEVGLRALSFGPLSGFGATIGGAAAQNGGFFGAASYGAYGDGGICGGKLVDGTGQFVTLNADDRADGLAAPQPLVGDCGAFGIRTEVRLRLMPRPAASGFASFAFADGPPAIAALAALKGLPGLGEAYVFDPGTHANLAKSGFSIMESASIASDLLKARGGIRGRIEGLINTARAGRTFTQDLAWSLHLSIDGTEAAVAEGLAAATELALAEGGRPIADVIPRVTRAKPFRRIKALLGPDGEVWLPVHGVFPAAGAGAGLDAVTRTLAEQAAEMAAHQVRAVVLAVLMGGRMIIEPQLYWPDALSAVHRAMAQPDQVARFDRRPANLAARRVAHETRQLLTRALDGAGASHFQVGRSYAAHPGVSEAARAAWRTLKQRFDPDGIMNPGVLGL